MGDAAEVQNDSYLMQRGRLASARLTTQHFVITERQGWLVHPEVEKHLEGRKDVVIADLATGNGIWALSLSKKHPNAQIVGLDITSQQLPPPSLVPNNVAFDVYNFWDPVPEKYQNCFDLIHIRLIVAAIHGKDPSVMLAHLFSMLKPGGFVQWDEVVDSGAIRVDTSMHVDISDTSYITRVAKHTGVGGALKWAGSQLSPNLKKEGFTSIIRHEPPLNPSMLHLEAECMAWSLQELIDQTKLMEDQKPGVAEEMQKAEEELNRDIDDGKMLAYNWAVTVGQKPIAV